MEPEDVRGDTRVRVGELLNNVDELKSIVLPENITPRRKGAIGTVKKGIAGAAGPPGNAVLVYHEDDDGLGRFNGEVAAYYACEFDRFA